MRTTLAVAALALVSWSCGEKCQEFYSDPTTDPAQNTKLGIGFEARLVVGYSSDAVVQNGMLPPGMTLAVSDGKLVVSGTPTTAGEYQMNVQPKTQACEFKGASLGNMVLQLTVAPAQCDDPVACRLLGSTVCTQTSACTAHPPYVSAACIHTVADAGVCVDVNGPADVCNGAVSAATVTTVEGAQVQTCIATPAITGCNNHVCYGAP